MFEYERRIPQRPACSATAFRSALMPRGPNSMHLSCGGQLPSSALGRKQGNVFQINAYEEIPR